MILPTTYFSALLLLIVSMLCWGSWANTQKLAGKWRFELFYYDYSVGVLLCALIAAFTLGQMAPKELSFTDNFLIASKRQMAYGVGAGIVFNLANLVLVAIIVDAFAYSAYTDAKRMAAEKAALRPDPRVKKSVPTGPGAGRGIVLSVVGGILMGMFYPLVEMSREGDGGVSPYGIGILFGAGVVFSSLFYIPFFLNFPVNGAPVETR